MRKLLIFLLFTGTSFLLKSQCSVQVMPVMVSCYGDCDGSASAYPIGSGPFSFYWLPGGQTTQWVSGLCAGNYTLVITDNTGCNSSETFTIVQPPQLYVNTSAQAASCQSCCDGFIISTVVGGTPPYTYEWSTNPVQMTSTAQAVCPGTYTLCVTDAAGCSNCSAATVNFSTGVENVTSSGILSVYPTPVNQSVTLDQTFENATNVEISVSDLLGQIMYVNNLGSVVNMHDFVDMTNFPAGIYLITVNTDSGSRVRKIMKE